MAYQQQQPMESSHAPAEQGGAEWTEPMFDCFNPIDDCLTGTFVPCFLLGKTSERVRDPSMKTYQPFNMDFLISLGITAVGCGWVYTMMKRTELREKYGIKGTPVEDCCWSFWCGCCSLIQHEKEVIRRTGGPVVGLKDYQGYMANNQGMQMPQGQQPQQAQVQPQGQQFQETKPGAVHHH